MGEGRVGRCSTELRGPVPSEVEDRGVSLLGFPGSCTLSLLSWVTLGELVYLCNVPNLLVSGKRPRHSLQLLRCPIYTKPDRVPGLG